MQEFLVSIEIESTDLTLREISDALRVRSSHGSNHPTEIRGGRVTIWRLRSTAGRTASLTRHLVNVFGRIDLDRWFRLMKRSQARCVLRVGILYDDAMVLTEIPNEFLTRAAQMGLTLEISCYPCTFAKTPRAKPRARN